MSIIMETTDSKPKAKVLPFPVYYGVVAFLAMSGIGVSLYLAISHYKVFTDIGYKSFCALSKAINCDTVAQSPYAIFAGVPVAVWGMIGYVIFLLISTVVWRRDAEKKRGWALLSFMAGIFSLVSVALAAVSSLIIHSYCIMCLISYGINFLLLYFAWLIRRRFDQAPWIMALREDLAFFSQRRRMSAVGLAVAISIVGVTMGAYPDYWALEQPLLEEHIATGVTEEGHPWIGAQDPDLEIVEFGDYLCFQCKKMHYFLRELVARYPDRIRLIHRHFPMDHKFNPIVKDAYHVGSGKLALLAIYATVEGRFWEFNDVVYHHARGSGGMSITQMAELSGLDANRMAAYFDTPEMKLHLKRDILTGIHLGMEGTPGFLIDGQLYQGQIPPEILKRFID